jgi:hypothetical protein
MVVFLIVSKPVFPNTGKMNIYTTNNAVLWSVPPLKNASFGIFTEVLHSENKIS